MSAPPGATYWIDGKATSAEAAHAPVLAHGLHYGTAVFEGIRAYDTPRGIAIFRLGDHLLRFFASAAHYGLEPGYSLDRLRAAIVETVRASGLRDAYIRPLAYFGDETIALTPRSHCSTHVAIAVFGFPPLMEGTAGARATISPVQKFSSRALPATVKASGHYTNSVLALQDAVARGFDEAILLNERGEVSEGSGENIFIVRDAALRTNDASADILYGITRDSILQIAGAEGIPATVGPIALDDLWQADEAFFTGTAAEVIPILSIDARPLPQRRPITTALREAYARIVHAGDERYDHWLTFVAPPAP
jgi:branched-chain amino acid aminotransferase